MSGYAHYETEVLPAVFERLPSVFPEFGFRRRGSRWIAAKCSAEESPLGVRGDRIVVGMTGGGYPSGFGDVAGGCYSFLGYITGNPHTFPKGKDFFAAAAKLASMAGVDPGPLAGGPPVDPETVRAARERLERQRRENHRRQLKASRESVKIARELFEAADRGPAGAPHPAVAAYIGARGVDIAAVPARSWGRLRFCMRTPIGDGRSASPRTAPAIVAAVTRTNREGGETLVAVHRLFVAEDGRSIGELGKRMLGPVRGGCVKLGTPGEAGAEDAAADTLLLCEGIETGLAIRAATRMPVWACLSTSGLRSVDLPTALVEAGTLRRVVVMGDFDDPDLRDKHGKQPTRGQHAAREAAERIAEAFPALFVAWRSPEEHWDLVGAAEQEGAAA